MVFKGFIFAKSDVPPITIQCAHQNKCNGKSSHILSAVSAR